MIYLALGPAATTADTNPTRLFSGAMVANVGNLLVETLIGLLGGVLSEAGVTCTILLAGIALYSNRSHSVFCANHYDTDEYSFRHSVTLVPAGALAEGGGKGGESMLETINRAALRCRQ